MTADAENESYPSLQPHQRATNSPGAHATLLQSSIKALGPLAARPTRLLLDLGS